MLAVIIPTLNADAQLADLLQSLGGNCNRLIVSDGGSHDKTLTFAAKYGAVIVTGGSGRGQQMRRGVSWALDNEWFLFLHADGQMPKNWSDAVNTHIGNYPDHAGYFNLKFDSHRWQARFVEKLVWLRSQYLGLPYGDQGLLISRKLYETLGGYKDMVLFEDVDLVRRLGRSRLKPLNTTITTNAAKYERDGFFRRGLKNLRLLRRYYKGTSIDKLARDYQ